MERKGWIRKSVQNISIRYKLMSSFQQTLILNTKECGKPFGLFKDNDAVLDANYIQQTIQYCVLLIKILVYLQTYSLQIMVLFTLLTKESSPSPKAFFNASSLALLITDVHLQQGVKNFNTKCIEFQQCKELRVASQSNAKDWPEKEHKHRYRHRLIFRNHEIIALHNDKSKPLSKYKYSLKTDLRLEIILVLCLKEVSSVFQREIKKNMNKNGRFCISFHGFQLRRAALYQTLF